MKIARLFFVACATIALASGVSADAERMDAEPEVVEPEGAATAAAANSMEASTEQASELAPVAPPEPAAAEPQVARAVVTRAIHEREPVDQVESLESDQKVVYFFTDLRNLQGLTVTHRWELDGVLMAEVPFSVGASRWRVWSSKNLVPESVGSWVVSVVGSGGQVLESATFQVSAPTKQPAAQ